MVCLCRKSFGRALILDGVIQLTEKDEFSYQEMLASLPINCHPDPEKVLSYTFVILRLEAGVNPNYPCRF